jgi:hypothetical protein
MEELVIEPRGLANSQHLREIHATTERLAVALEQDNSNSVIVVNGFENA